MRSDTRFSKDLAADNTRFSPQLLASLTVSIACTAAAIATGSYAFWLFRRRIADDALISVHDLLETCRERVTHMEHELEMINASSRSAATHVT